jgi:hypothetical protein
MLINFFVGIVNCADEQYGYEQTTSFSRHLGDDWNTSNSILMLPSTCLKPRKPLNKWRSKQEHPVSYYLFLFFVLFGFLMNTDMGSQGTEDHSSLRTQKWHEQ